MVALNRVLLEMLLVIDICSRTWDNRTWKKHDADNDGGDD